MTYEWVQIRSWHMTAAGSWTTLCGREVASRMRQIEPPIEQKTCERCFQLRERKSS